MNAPVTLTATSHLTRLRIEETTTPSQLSYSVCEAQVRSDAIVQLLKVGVDIVPRVSSEVSEQKSCLPLHLKYKKYQR